MCCAIGACKGRTPEDGADQPKAGCVVYLAAQAQRADGGSLDGAHGLFEEQLQAVQDDSTLLEQWEAELETLTEERNRLALLLHESRGKALEPLSSDLCSRLALLGIPHAQLVFDLQVKPEYGPLGNSGLQMLFSANRDVEPKELSRIASGGEMSRLMLCIKSITAQSAGLNTIIFDEVDLGVSGKIADSMGDMIYALSGHMQVLAITHLPQVAAKGGTHYLVKKNGRKTLRKPVSYF